MRWSVGLYAAAAVALGLAARTSPAAAQGFFEQLFGIAAPKPPPAQSPANPQLTPGGRPYSFPGSPVPRRSSDDDDERQGPRVKTVCVRMCDGYFFPISNSTGRKSLYRDQMRCRAACGDDARLFHLPAGSTEMAEAADGNGRIYGLLSVAYRYRKTLTPGCQCRPAPWSEAEVARHHTYAVADADKQRQQRADNAEKSAADKTIGEKAEAAAIESDGSAPQKEPVKSANATPAGKAAQSIRAATTPATGRRAASIGQSSRRTQAPSAAQASSGLPPEAGLGAGALTWPGDGPPRR